MQLVKWPLCLTLTILLLTSGGSAYAVGSRQKEYSQGDEARLLRACDEALVQLRAERERVAVLTEKSTAQERLAAALDEKVAALELLNENLRATVKTHEEIAALSDKERASYEKSIADCKENFERVVKERDHQARMKLVYGVGGVVLGILLGVLASKD